MAEKTCEGRVWRRKGYQQKQTVLFLERTHQEVPFSWDPLAFETTSFVSPSLTHCATTVVVVASVDVRVYT